MEHLSGYSFTVLISCYRNDDPNKFSMALQSIADNTLSPVMVVLVVDGSIPDDLNDVILTFAKTLPLNVQRLPENVGLALALNHGLSFVETDFCIRADADDLNLLDRFDQIIDKLKSGIDVVGSYIAEYDSVSNAYVSTKYVPVNHQSILKFAVKRNPFNHMSVGFVTSKVRDVGGYPNIYLREDYGLWIKLLKNGAITYNIPKVMVHASAGTGMFKRRGGISHIKAEIEMQRLLVNLGFKSVWRGVIHWTSKSIVYLLPPFLRKYIYLYFLRN